MFPSYIMSSQPEILGTLLFDLNCPLCIISPSLLTSIKGVGFSDALQGKGILWLGLDLQWHLVVPHKVGCWQPGGTAPWPKPGTGAPGPQHWPAQIFQGTHLHLGQLNAQAGDQTHTSSCGTRGNFRNPFLHKDKQTLKIRSLHREPVGGLCSPAKPGCF